MTCFQPFFSLLLKKYGMILSLVFECCAYTHSLSSQENANLHKAFVAGVLRIAQSGFFSDLNNLWIFAMHNSICLALQKMRLLSSLPTTIVELVQQVSDQRR
ncbi:LOW QUALITY PROTEIN: hypothetical protein BC938DRAFT_475116 [Jimgerdemannia flammicorona]|uniref:Secreted protein n=1 Tax=Jimgerdemannia flammicorona TaxID=994334 RepID=A0A433Q0I7_9FUNG|nr:LOW QUALITY PROTEIN: hypothetical protein BC938DRAFT_475116 [Jimgerdemannia flammicorona]